MNRKFWDTVSFNTMLIVLIVVLISIMIFCLIRSLYTYGKLELEDLTTVSGTITDVSYEGRYRNSWSYSSRTYLVIFSFSDGNKYFIPVETNGDGRKLEARLASLQEEVVLTFTSRNYIHPVKYLATAGCKRLVSLETENEVICSVDDYNDYNKEERIGCLIEAIVIFLAICFFIWLRHKMF